MSSPTAEDSDPRWRSRFNGLAWHSLRFLAIVAAAWVVLWIVDYLRFLIVPILLATFLASLATPAAQRLKQIGWPPLLATWVVTLVATGVVGLVIWFLVVQIAGATDDIGQSLQDAWAAVKGWLADSPMGFDREQIEEFLGSLTQGGGANGIFQRVLAGAGTVTEVVTGFVLTILVAFFMIKDGDRFWNWLTSKVPEHRREPLQVAGQTAWTTLRRYLGGTAVVGVVEAVLIGAALLILGVGLAIPLALLMFAGAFFPFVGAFVAGTLVALVTLATSGLIDALIMIAVVVVVQQLEGNALAPVVLGQAVEVHPLIIIMAITAGVVVFGLIGAFLAVPVVGVAAQVTRKLRPRWLETG